MRCSYVPIKVAVHTVVPSWRYGDGKLLRRVDIMFKDICGYFQCAPFPRVETGKDVWVLSFEDQYRFPIFLCHIRVPTFS